MEFPISNLDRVFSYEFPPIYEEVILLFIIYLLAVYLLLKKPRKQRDFLYSYLYAKYKFLNSGRTIVHVVGPYLAG